MTFVKICGITNLEDALASVRAGADGLGFNFYPPSPRFIQPKLARHIIEALPDEVLTVGVFVNEKSPSDVIRIVEDSGVNAIQLHGDESPEYCAALPGHDVIKALRVGSSFVVATATAYSVAAVMLDGFDDQLRGGTGKVFDWSIAASVCKLVPKLFLAGGLAPENVAEAIAAVDPYAVDACSALESVPGKKDPDRVELFIRRARGDV
jgi:phosphoribosylanthranilate isomerase